MKQRALLALALVFVFAAATARAETVIWEDPRGELSPDDLAKRRRDRRKDARGEFVTGIVFSTLSVLVGGSMMALGAWNWKQHGSPDLLDGGGYYLLFGSLTFAGLGVGGATLIASGINEQRLLDASSASVELRF